MARRQITRTRKNLDGDITALCDEGSSWSPQSKSDAISDIERGIHQYFVRWNTGHETTIDVVNGPSGKYLRTDRDSTPRNNLDELPDC